MQTICNHQTGNRSDVEYDAFLGRINARLLANCDHGAQPLFMTDAPPLWPLYLDSFSDPTERQYHNCHACRRFVERFGALATIGKDGQLIPALWTEEDAPEVYRPALAAMARAIRRADVTGVFLSSEKVWGTPETGVWHHLAARPAASMLFKESPVQSAKQAMAEKLEDFKNVTRALKEFTLSHVETALVLLRSDALYRSEKVLGQAEWLHALHTAVSSVRGWARDHIVWRAVASAPAGFCHPRSSMIGTLLSDIAEGKDFGDVSRAFAAKMHPLSYRRPKAAPSAGTIEAAEKLVKQLGLQASLDRRFARLDEIQAVWLPKKQEAPDTDSVFGHLKSRAREQTKALPVPQQTMTWEKFQRTLLPTADRLEFKAPSHGSYTALVTAVNKDAPPILQWDMEGARNPVSWYFWTGGAPASQFGLVSGQFYEVSAVTLKPSMWGGENKHQGKGVMFVLSAARESRDAGSALFPEIMKSELHGIRSVIEAHSRTVSLQGRDEPHAAGVMLTDNAPWDAVVRVWSSGHAMDVRLDRWD